VTTPDGRRAFGDLELERASLVERWGDLAWAAAAGQDRDDRRGHPP
jgi:hypothetical protein